jgi:hypothetical protein
LKHPLALATHPGLLRRDGQDGSAELEALPATCRQTNSRTALREEGAQGLIFASPLRSAPGTPCHLVRASNGLSESCPKTQTYRSLRLPSVAALVPSAGAITTANRVAFGADAPQHPASGRVRTLRGARSVSSKAAKIMEVRSILHEPSFTRLLQGAAAGALVTMIVGFNWGERSRPSPSARQGPTLPLTEA